MSHALPSQPQPFSSMDAYGPTEIESHEADHPLLERGRAKDEPGSDEEEEDIEMQRLQVDREYGLGNSTPSYYKYQPNPEKPWQFFIMGSLAMLVIFGGVYGVLALFQKSAHQSTPGGHLDTLFARQSKNLQQARARYSLKNDGREPPEHYDDWYSFAQRKQCLIDDYDKIYKDFEPFYQLAEEDPEYFKKAMDKALEVTKKDGLYLRAFSVKGGQLHDAGGGGTLYEGDWPRTFKRFVQYLPDMTFILSGQDEPRILFDYHKPHMRQEALNMSDETPFKHNPHPTADFFGPQGEGRCLLPNSNTGFGDLTNDHNAFILSSATTQFTTDLLPVLSVTKVPRCFSDILVPSEFYYRDSGWSPKYENPDTIAWEDKEQKMYWWGGTSGGMIVGQNYHEFPRFKLIEIGRNHSDILEVGLSHIPMYANCRNSTECDQPYIQEEYGVGKTRPREEGYKYRYAFDVDGNSFSGRYLGLLRTHSLVFKSTIFDEYFNDWLRPFEHYIPVLPDLSDLVHKVQWAIAHDAEAKQIQQNGRLVAERILTDAQNDCYFFAVLLEYARLQKGTPIRKRNTSILRRVSGF